MTTSIGMNIDQIVKDPENVGRNSLVPSLANIRNKAKDTQASLIISQKQLFKVKIVDIQLSKFVGFNLACATQKASHKKQNP